MRAGTIALGGAVALAAAALGGALWPRRRAPAAAATPAPMTAAQVDVTACQACHGANGVSRNQHVPNLAGQPAAYLVLQLQAFKNGTRQELIDGGGGRPAQRRRDECRRPILGQPAGRRRHDAHAAAAGPAIPSRMAFPAAFPTGFTLYQTANSNGAVAEHYANALALAAARAGRPLPDGSVILVVNRPAAGAPPTGYAAMEARAGWGAAIPALIRDGDWDFAVFNAQRARNDGLNQAQCLACHHPQAANSHVFTLAELRAAAMGAGA